MKYLLILLISVVTPVSMAGSDASNDGPKLVIRKFVETYWAGKITPDDLAFVRGYEDDLTVKFIKALTIDKKGTAIHVCANSQVRFIGRMIWEIEAKSAGCKVGDLEAVEGTTIEFWESSVNSVRSIVTAKPAKLRGYIWPARSTLFFDTDPERKPRLYAALLGDDLKGSQFTSGQKVYVGRIIDDTGRRNDELSLVGEDPIL